MKLSEEAWQRSSNIFKKILKHPFNQELMFGTLPNTKFFYYLEQDAAYTVAEVRLDENIAKRIVPEYQDDFDEYRNEAIEYKILIDAIFKQNPNATLTGNITAATMDYTNHFDASIFVPVEVALAKGLPCYWFYKEMGIYMSSHQLKNNPYQEFINSYSDPEYIESTNQYINIFDNLAANASQEVRQKMLDAFYQSAVYEWRFFDDAYYMQSFDEIG